MKIVVTGGPVHAYLDAVKIITNRFKGGLMATLASDLHALTGNEIEIVYICDKGNVKVPPYFNSPANPNNKIIYHDGFEDYRHIVKEQAKDADAVILGAAVANLIPHPDLWKYPSQKAKFPSHNYKPGDRIDIPFTIAPRVVDEVKAIMPKHGHLFAFKLLSGVSHEELITAAYDIVLESKASAVFANDATDLNTVFAVTKERAEHKMVRGELAKFILDIVNDDYFKTLPAPAGLRHLTHEGEDRFYRRKDEAYDRLKLLAEKFKDKFLTTQGGYVFGSISTLLGVPGGSGRLSKVCLDLNARSVAMVDKCGLMLDPELEKRDAHAADDPFSFYERSVKDYISHIAYPLFFNLIFCQQAINYWLFNGEAVGLIDSVLRENGAFVFNTFNKRPARHIIPNQYIFEGKKYTEISYATKIPPSSELKSLNDIGACWVNHIQMMEGVEPHSTQFLFMPPDYLNMILSSFFKVERYTLNRTDIYVCRKKVVEG